MFSDFVPAPIDRDVSEIVRSVVSKHLHSTDAELKRDVYLTAPMKAILKREKSNRENWFNRPIDFEVLLSS